ncbi:hypothetical protein KVR01_007891 [Diaporthe batatas]|uniref:uncharacterized protein n=1 Tax=Diaporthe batatas TaxID=748121 RepID=UPI001D04C2A5|nr:uncharacterized protein KVR01_007891 [Diaporthe batatas]KAG8162126.1 hypothetical protein KVR01_007891 [Diaporthe batatas]
MNSGLYLLNAVLSLLASRAVAELQHPPNAPHQSAAPLFPSLIDATLADLSTGLENGAFTSVDLVQTYVARIQETNGVLHAVTEINPDALAIAASLDAARRDGQVFGPLHGIPVLIKNNIATSDKMNNTAGSYALLGATVPYDSSVAAKLRKAGAVILGKSNLSQWSDARSENSSNGWSAHGGQTQGAYHPAQDPCGSSAGSGVAASLGLAWAALGTETSGSIQCPACYNNVVGIKPTVGLTSRHLVIPISEHQDTVGPLARTVEDAAFLLQAIVGRDEFDNYTAAIPFDSGYFPDYVSACQTSALNGKRIGVTRSVIDMDEMGVPDEATEPLMTAFNGSLDIIRSAGATVVDDIFLPGWKPFMEGDYATSVLFADFFTVMPRYLSHLEANPHNISSLRDISRFTHRYPYEDYPARDTAIFDRTLEKSKNNTDYDVWMNRTHALRLAGTMGILGAMKNYSLDAIVLPTYFAAYPPAILGTPAVTVPMGRYPDDMPIVKNRFGNLVGFGPNIPFGISFLGESFTEEKLIGMAYAFEQRTMVRKQVHPYLQPKTEIADVIGTRWQAMELEL